MVAGHTREVFDGAFGHVNRRLKSTDVYSTQYMMGVVRASSVANVCVPGSKALWRSWKLYGALLYDPARFPISKYRIFTYTSSKAESFTSQAFPFSCE